MPRAICEDCGSLVEAELTHNGICAVGHYVHCGWGHELSPDDLISDDVVEIIADLEAKPTKAVEALVQLERIVGDILGAHLQDSESRDKAIDLIKTTLAELEAGK